MRLNNELLNLGFRGRRGRPNSPAEGRKSAVLLVRGSRELVGMGYRIDTQNAGL